VPELPRQASRRIAALVCAVVGVAASPAAHGERGAGEPGKPPAGATRDVDHHYEMVIASGWRPVAPPDGTLAAYGSITWVDVGLRGARDAAALVAQVERGVERATAGFQRVRHKLGQARQTPVLDLWYRRAPSAGAALILSRYLFFSRHTAVLSIGLEAGAGRDERRAAEAMLKSFTPLQ